MKILHVITDLDIGGAEKQLLSLVKEQVENYDLVEVMFLKGFGDLAGKFQSTGSKVSKFDSPLSLRSWWNILVRLPEFDVTHAHLPRAELFIGILSVCRKVKFVVSKHNSERFFPKGPPLFSRVLSLFVENRARAVICISNSVFDYLVSIKEVKKREKYITIHYGIDYSADSIENRIECVNEEKGIQLESQLSDVRIICIARLTEQKNLLFLLDVMTKLPSNYYLRIYGTGHMRDLLIAEIERLSLDHRVILAGKSTSINLELQDSDVMVLPSLYEGFGLVLLEAVANDVPIVASDISSIREVLGEDYPFLASPTDACDFARAITRIQFWEDTVRQKCYEELKTKYGLKKNFEAINQVYLKCSRVNSENLNEHN